MDNITYDCRWSDSLNDKFISDFLSVQFSVFGHSLPRPIFNRKYIHNPYGRSVLIVVYLSGEPCAIDALWRNDIDGKISYQSADTGVLSICRGKGIFREMVRIKLDKIKDIPCIVYGFPNINSFPGFTKMGWLHVSTYRPVLFFFNFQFLRIHRGELIDSDYVNWWIKGRDGYYYYKHFNHYYLVAVRSKFRIVTIIGEISKETASSLKRYHFPLIIFYKGIRCTLYNSHRTPSRIISLSKIENKIPCWKLDAI